ncbi:MAG: TlpA disulfide reductase family protein [Alphaproteobacteria bacterium]
MPGKRLRFVALGAAVVAAAGIVVWALWPAAPGTGGQPPIAGHVSTFEPADSVRPAPDIAFLDGAGNAVRLADFKGQVVLLNFWATWCGPCRREMPSLDRLAAAVAEEDITVLALSIDARGLEVIRPFYDERAIANLPIYMDPDSGVYSAFGVWNMPTTVVIDRDGREAGRLIGPAEWDSADALRLLRWYAAKG